MTREHPAVIAAYELVCEVLDRHQERIITYATGLVCGDGRDPRDAILRELGHVIDELPDIDAAEPARAAPIAGLPALIEAHAALLRGLIQQCEQPSVQLMRALQVLGGVVGADR